MSLVCIDSEWDTDLRFVKKFTRPDSGSPLVSPCLSVALYGSLWLSVTPTLAPAGSIWLSLSLSLSLYGSLWLPATPTLALSGSLRLLLALGDSYSGSH